MPCRRIDFYQNFLGNSCLSFHKEVSLSSLNTEHEVRSLYPTVYILNFRFNILNGCYPLGSFNQKFLPVNLDVKKSKRCEFFKIFIGKSTAVKKVRVSDLIKKEQHLQKYWIQRIIQAAHTPWCTSPLCLEILFSKFLSFRKKPFWHYFLEAFLLASFVFSQRTHPCNNTRKLYIIITVPA